MIHSYKVIPDEAVVSAELREDANKRAKYKMLRVGIWVYFILLIFEGALRKWVFPGLATPLLIIRDPVAAWLIILALHNSLLKPNIYLTGICIITVISIFTTLFIGHGNLYVALFGARVFLLHFPLIFVIGRVFERKDVIFMGKVILAIAVPMTILIAIQFYSPQSAWVNRGIGEGSEGGGFSGALGFFRPPATFSFITGTASFFSLVGCFIFYFWLSANRINRILLAAATISLMASIPLSISRSLFFGVVLSLVFAIMAILRKPEYLGKLLLGLFVGTAIFLTFSDNPAVKAPIEAFTTRFTSANEAEGGLKGVAGDRFLGGMFDAIVGSSDQPFFGYGLGMGTNVGAMLLSGKSVFLISEGEWGRLTGEQGPLLGLLVIILRVLFCIQLLIAAYRRLQIKDLLPWMLLNFALINIAQGQWGQPTSLGFSVVIGGLMLASFKKSAHKGF
ncbi:hypothetical protein WG906_16050 [Pedobacter sp. P351]|uniref:hypothetical protein n=1 Tax=Pedobacter superstes TaxID=3133441 RepID=UPI00309F79F9